MSVRLVAACVAIAMLVAVPLQPMTAEAKPDGYDVGAAIMTVAGAPLKGLVCGIGAVVGATLFLATFGSADRASAAVVKEGCDQRWLVRGEHLRPDLSPARVLELDPDPRAAR